MSPFSFLILLIWILSLCPLVSLAKGLSILLIFSKKQLLVWLILCIVLFLSVSLMADSSRQALESAISGTRHEYPRLEAAHSASKR